MVAALAFSALISHAQDGISKSAVTMRQSPALTGSSATLGVPFTQGAKLYFDRLNIAGGINGRKLELVCIDDSGRADVLRGSFDHNLYSIRPNYFEEVARQVRNGFKAPASVMLVKALIFASHHAFAFSSSPHQAFAAAPMA